MAWRSVVIQNPARLQLANRQLLIRQDDREATVPLEDITTLIFDHPQIILTTALMSAMQEYGIAAVSCDDKHMPNGILLPFHQHSRHSEVASLQTGWSKPFTKKLWQNIVKQKIINQSECLGRHDREGKKRLAALAVKVNSGDPENIEAQAARAYWGSLFGKSFRRGKMDITNSALNYGYAVLRAIIARSIVGYGLLPSFGIHHGNNLNAFNLADDLIEPFRPFLDDMVTGMQFIGTDSLDKADRAKIAMIGHLNCRIGDEVHTLTNAADMVASDLVVATRMKKPLIRMPQF